MNAHGFERTTPETDLGPFRERFWYAAIGCRAKHQRATDPWLRVRSSPHAELEHEQRAQVNLSPLFVYRLADTTHSMANMSAISFSSGTRGHHQ